MTRVKLLSAGLLSAAMLATPVMAQEATQEPAVMGFNYPNVDYMKGGYGHRFTPRPGDYYSGRAYRAPALTAPYGYGYGYGYYGRPSYYGSYGYYNGPY